MLPVGHPGARPIGSGPKLRQVMLHDNYPCVKKEEEGVSFIGCASHQGSVRAACSGWSQKSITKANQIIFVVYSTLPVVLHSSWLIVFFLVVSWPNPKPLSFPISSTHMMIRICFSATRWEARCEQRQATKVCVVCAVYICVGYYYVVISIS